MPLVPQTTFLVVAVRDEVAPRHVWVAATAIAAVSELHLADGGEHLPRPKPNDLKEFLLRCSRLVRGHVEHHICKPFLTKFRNVS